MTLQEYWDWEKKVSILTSTERKAAREQWNRVDGVNPVDWHIYLLDVVNRKWDV